MSKSPGVPPKPISFRINELVSFSYFIAAPPLPCAIRTHVQLQDRESDSERCKMYAPSLPGRQLDVLWTQ